MPTYKEISAITLSGVAAVALTVMTFQSTDLQAAEPTNVGVSSIFGKATNVQKKEEFGLPYVTGKLDRDVNFICSHSKKYPDQVVCSFFPENIPESTKEGIKNILMKAFKDGEKIEI